MDNRKRQDAGPSGLEIYSLEDLLSEPQETPDAASSRADASKSSGTGDSADSDHVADSAHDIQDAEHTTLDEDIIGAVRKARTSGISRDEFTVTTDTSPVPVIVGTSLVEEEDKAGRTGRDDSPVSVAGARRSPAGSDVGEPDADEPYANNPDAGETGGRRQHPRVNLHVLLAIVIVAVAAAAGIRFYVWSRGDNSLLPTTSQKEKYLVEVNDNMVLLPEDKLKGHEDDGVTTILALGNAPFSDDTGKSGLAGQIASLGNATVINAAFPGSEVTCQNASYKTDSQEDMDDIFNLFYVSYAISLQDYSSLENVAKFHADEPQYAAAIENLKNTDMNKVDVIAIMYDASDYQNRRPVYNEGNQDELVTYVGSLRSSFKLLQEKYPWVRIVFMSPTYMLHKEENGTSEDGRTTDLGNGTLIQYWQFAYDTCGDCSVSFLDNYYGSVNDSNYRKYLKDSIHLNKKGFTKIADHFVYKVLQNKYDEYDAGSLMVSGS